VRRPQARELEGLHFQLGPQLGAPKETHPSRVTQRLSLSPAVRQTHEAGSAPVLGRRQLGRGGPRAVLVRGPQRRELLAATLRLG
jgi:hypothetical protein